MFFFFNDTATTEIYTLSLHDALPIYAHQPVLLGIEHRLLPVRPHDNWADMRQRHQQVIDSECPVIRAREAHRDEDRKSTRLNSSHANISYAVFCLKKNNITQ